MSKLPELKMLNGNIATRAVEGLVDKDASGIIIPTNAKSYKILEATTAFEDIVSVGDILYVPITAGNDIDIDGIKFVIVNIREIILIK